MQFIDTHTSYFFIRRMSSNTWRAVSYTLHTIYQRQCYPKCTLDHFHAADESPYSIRDPLDEILHSFWNLESLGVDTKADSVLEEFTQTVQFKDGRYEVSLPWKNSHPMLPDNYLLSRKRLGGLIKRLRHDPEVLKEYDSIIQSQRSQGIVEEVNLQEESSMARYTSYLTTLL